MTLNSSALRWLKPALWAGLAVALILAWLHLAGAVVLAGVGRNFNAATPLTFIQYALYYGEQKRIGLWLWSGAGLSSLALLAPLALFLKPAKRSLHGDARFASSSEIRKAGLTGKKGIICCRRLKTDPLRGHVPLQN